MYSLIKNKREVLTSGSESKCLKHFHRVCSFSYSNHKKYSYDHYEVVKTLERALDILLKIFKRIDLHIYNKKMIFLVLKNEEIQKDIIKFQDLEKDLKHDLIGLSSGDKFFVPRILKENII